MQPINSIVPIYSPSLCLLDVNQLCQQGHTPLHLAIYRNQLTSLAHLIALGCNVEKPDAKGVQPVHLACELNNVGALKVSVSLLDC